MLRTEYEKNLRILIITIPESDIEIVLKTLSLVWAWVITTLGFNNINRFNLISKVVIQAFFFGGGGGILRAVMFDKCPKWIVIKIF